MSRVFPLAPMSPGIRGLTFFVLALPVVLVAIAWPFVAARGLVWIALFLLLLYASVWLWWRPREFELSESELVVRFPLRRLSTPRSRLVAAEFYARGAELRKRLGFAVRIGAGGLFGGFGWLWTSNLGLIEFYVSRTDDLVLIERTGARPLLIAPERAAEFHAALGLPSIADR